MPRFDPFARIPRGMTLLEASAGTGKTYSITSVVLRLLVQEGLGIERILVVTYTEAATAELRDRIRDRIRAAHEAFEAARQHDATKVADEVIADLLTSVRSDGEAAFESALNALHTALIRFDTAQISTIHGFCAGLLRANAFECGADFDATMLTDPSELIDELVYDFWARTIVTLPSTVVAGLVENGVCIADLCVLAKQVLGEPGMKLVPTLEELGQTQATPGRESAAEELRIKLEFVRWVRIEAEQRKRSRRLQTYEDLLRQVQRALRDDANGPRLVEAVRARIEAALIDEFHDTDGVQWEIFHTLFNSQQRFLVLIGDPKQAIYSFRGADINAYLSAKRAVSLVQDLDVNWRSDGPLVNAVNVLFKRLKYPFAEPGIGYPEVHARNETARLSGDSEAPFRIRFLRREGPLAPAARKKTVSKGALTRVVLEDTARDIARFLDGTAYLNDEDQGRRLVTPRDVAVLVRANWQGKSIQHALRQHGIPSVRRGASSIFESTEASDLETVLSAVLEPSNVRAVRRALATDLLGRAAAAELSEEIGSDVADTGIGNLLAHLEDDEPRLDRWLERFHSWSERWARHGITPMIRAMIDDVQMPRRLLAFADGERQLTNLRHLTELLHTEAIERSADASTLHGWLHEQRLSNDGQNDAHQLRLESDEDAVNVITIHSSKGLEYPVVWCPFLWDGVSSRKKGKAYVEFRSGDADDPNERSLDIDTVKWDQTARAAHEAARDADEFAERLRLMYVALTRARHRCTVYWAGVNEGGCSPLAWLLHGGNNERATDALKAMKDVVNKTDADLLIDINAIADASAQTISVSDTAHPAGIRWTRNANAPATLKAAPWRRAVALDSSWRIGSFTGLTRRAHEHREDGNTEPQPEFVADARLSTRTIAEVAREKVPSGPTPAATVGSVPLATFPSSAKVGIFFHELLEELDFQDDRAIEESVSTGLRNHGLNASRWTHDVSENVRATLGAAIGTDGHQFALRDTARDRRLAELRFDFPVRGGHAPASDGFDVGALVGAFEQNPGGTMPRGYATAVRSLRFVPLRGFMTGSIDLVVEHGGRWYVIDYKSNLLGATLDDYQPDRLDEEMIESHYVLQYHLYLVALHRYLQWRIPGYDYDRDVGGACYLFLRGLNAKSTESGIYFDKPPFARIAALDAALSGGSAPS